jgi:hypothetical protein
MQTADGGTRMSRPAPLNFVDVHKVLDTPRWDVPGSTTRPMRSRPASMSDCHRPSVIPITFRPASGVVGAGSGKLRRMHATATASGVLVVGLP